MKLRLFVFLSFIILIAGGIPASAQADSVISQFTSSARDSYAGSISGDGRFVAFWSAATNLVDGDTNGNACKQPPCADVFVRDRVEKATTLP